MKKKITLVNVCVLQLVIVQFLNRNSNQIKFYFYNNKEKSVNKEIKYKNRIKKNKNIKNKILLTNNKQNIIYLFQSKKKRTKNENNISTLYLQLF